MKTLVIMIFLLLTVLIGGMVALSMMDPNVEQQTIKEQISLENL